MDNGDLLRTLRQEILFARRRIYEVGQATPLEKIELNGDLTIHVKREDLSPIHAYKWRGAYNCMAQLTPDELERGVVTASAGNHAQGVAVAANRLKTQAVIYMPVSTPRMKQLAVKKHGGSHVEIRLAGDTYDSASQEAHLSAKEENLTYVHAYDDMAVMAGQGTLADEIVMSGQGPFDIAFLQVGGGGMAAATATWLKMNFPGIHIVGVEGVDQASMAAAIEKGHPVSLEKIDIFCDGTAVREAGQLTYQVCKEVVDEWMTVTNDQVSAAVQFLWEQLRCIPEPSGAMGIAAVLKRREELAGKRILSVLCGSNMDFEQLATIASRSAIGAARRRYLRIDIPEKAGAMFQLLEALPDDVNIVDFQYGKTDQSNASPVIGFELTSIEAERLKTALSDAGYSCREVTSETDVYFRMIRFTPELLTNPYFITLEFHERPGALAMFLQEVSPHCNLCYFNYSYSGERVGRALMGFEFATERARTEFPQYLEAAHEAYRAYENISPDVLTRIL